MASIQFSSVGLRVLVVDDDNEDLKNLETMLKECGYKVTTCNSTKKATDMLGKEEERSKFDIVISGVNDGATVADCFAFLKYVSHNLKLPVIMMSRDGETSKVMSGIESGACIYLQKPVEMKELRFIWLHVFRKKMQHQRYQIEEKKFGKKRKDREECVGDSSPRKKLRVIWRDELENKFLRAVNQIGIEQATATKILLLMDEPSLTREQVSSHLQKYKLKMGERKAAEAHVTQVSLQPVVLLSNVDAYLVHSLDQPMNPFPSIMWSTEEQSSSSYTSDDKFMKAVDQKMNDLMGGNSLPTQENISSELQNIVATQAWCTQNQPNLESYDAAPSDCDHPQSQPPTKSTYTNQELDDNDFIQSLLDNIKPEEVEEELEELLSNLSDVSDIPCDHL